MYVVLELEDMNINNVFYQEKVKNTVIDNSNILRVVYSNELFTLNGIFIKLILNIQKLEKSFNKYNCIFYVNTHNNIVLKISSIEKNMLYRQLFLNKKPVYRISEQLNNGYLKIFNETDCKTTNEFILKIYGIWENEFEYGLTYKFISL